MLDYPVKLTRDDNGTILVTFPDFPEAQTFGDDVEDALGHAKDALATVIEAYIKDRREIPAPSAGGKHHVIAPALLVAKARLSETMRQSAVNKNQLARMMHVHAPQVDRLLNVHHGSTIDQLEAAFSALGQRMTVTIAPLEKPASIRKKTARPGIVRPAAPRMPVMRAGALVAAKRKGPAGASGKRR